MIRYDENAQTFNLEAETAVLAGLLLDNDVLSSVQDWLTPADFYSPDHARIYECVLELCGENKLADAITAGEWLLDKCGEEGRHLEALASEIAGGAYTRANVIPHAEIVVEHSRMRRFIDTCQRALKAATGRSGHSAEQLASHLASQMADIAPVRAVGPTPYRDVVRKFSAELLARHRDGIPIGLPTPWKDVNKAIGGLRNGQVIVIAARSNMGKSLMGFQLARFTGMRGDQVVEFSMEMVDTDVVARDVAAMGEIPLQWLVGNSDEESAADSDIYWSKAAPTMDELMKANILIDDDPQLSAPQIVARAKRVHRRKPLRLVVVDHLHEMALPGKQDEALERGQALRDLKGLAKFLDCPVVVLAQLNRAGAKGDRPKVTDIRGSGGIEEVADVILFVHRPDVYNPTDRPGLVEVIVGKGRNIKTGTVVSLRNEYQYQRATDWDGPAYEFDSSLPAPKAKPLPLAPRIGSRGRSRQGGEDD
ncbi:DnaB-like helicase C-terminal domain-containing protein [Stenotrophomonas maltophilia]|uniref:replicative DNA helicase n=1 Tax=Stenotrophomonas maltophilia TaxID=40324 RepID=UPI002ACD115F|nr:DnaB-like helicase C-terminal domain-containing protein [Stenotrophomonas maltophilia]MDZ5788528.1 DnaB-like helicase C-terminal domain-containing protein [Stenotrophomonas maltophilia]